jgi:hypothetical protein
MSALKKPKGYTVDEYLAREARAEVRHEVEVLSRSTETTDRREKWLAYGTMPSLRWYILAHSERPEVTYFARNRTGEWETATLEGAEGLEIDRSSAPREQFPRPSSASM